MRVKTPSLANNAACLSQVKTTRNTTKHFKEERRFLSAEAFSLLVVGGDEM
jgi:hypothetical protein